MITIQAVRALAGRPVKSYEWELFIPNPPGAVRALLPAFPLRVRTTFLPGVQNENFPTRFGPYTFMHAGKKGYVREVLVRFEEGPVFPIVPTMYLWNNLVFDESTGAGAPQESLVADMYMRVLLPDETPLYAIHYYYVFPSRVPDVTLDYRSSEPIPVDVLFQFDYWRLELWPF